MGINKFFITKTLLFISSLVFGNLFLLLFINSMKGEHLLTNSPLQIILSFIYPILSFSLYLCSILYFSIFVKEKRLWFLVCLLSFLSYPFLISASALNVAGGFVIATSLYFFLVSFKKFRILVNDKLSLLGQISISLMGVTLIISIVIAFNFYSFYRSILSQNNIIISDKLVVSSLSPVVKVYLDDLSLTNVDQTFGTYIQERSNATKESQQLVRAKTLARLSLKSASNTQTMRDLIKISLSNSILIIVSEYQKKLPLLISLGLAIITQTMMTVSTVLAGLGSLALLKLFQKAKLVKLLEVEIKSDSIVSFE